MYCGTKDRCVGTGLAHELLVRQRGPAVSSLSRKMYAPHDTQRRSVVNTSQHGLASNTVTISSKDGRLAGDADQQLCVCARVRACVFVCGVWVCTGIQECRCRDQQRHVSCCMART